MGGKSGKTTIGYKYYVGLHAVYCLGPIDAFTRITVDDRVAWSGSVTSGQIVVSAESLFGGSAREGGVSGTVDICMGGRTQTKNDYLLSKIGANIPAYRGVAAMVFRDFYWGNNPYLKAVRARGQRIHTTTDGATQWYDEVAAIPALLASTETIEGQTIEVAWEQSTFEQGANDQATMGIGFLNATGTLISSTYAPMIDTAPGIFTARNVSATAPAGTAGLRIFQKMHRRTGANNDGYIDGIAVTINGVTAAILNPGAETGDATGWTPSIGTGVRARGDSVRFEGVFVFDGGAQAEAESYQDLNVGQLDMNGSHIIRECLTDPDWGMGYAAGDIDDISFMAAADTLFAEGMGCSLIWSKEARIEDFIAEVVRHIDAALYVNRSTGQFVLKLIRDDYDPDALLTLDESNIERITSPSRPEFGELVNAVTVQFWNTLTGRDDSVSVQDPAGVQMQGGVISTTVAYQGFTNISISQRAAARDLRALSNPFFACTIYARDDARDLDIGDVFKLSWAKWQISGIVMRVTGFAIAAGGSNQIRLTCIEDVFSTPLNAVVVPPSEGWTDPSGVPSPAANELAGEVPYYEIVGQQGQTATDNALTSNPDLGYVFAAAARPVSAINAKLWTDAGAGYEPVDTMDFCPTATMQGAMGKTTLVGVLENGSDLDLVEIGQHCQIGDELLRVDSLDIVTGDVTFGRGVLDTVPQAHLAGDRVYFWDFAAGVDPTEYADGETVGLKVTPLSGAGAVDIADATEMLVTLDQRAYRPYPPGNLTIDGDSYVDAVYSGNLTVAWAHRDRTQETSGTLADHFDGDIGPEVGQLYRVQSYVDNVFDAEQDDLAASPAVVTPGGEGLIRIEASSKRDGLYSMQAATHEFVYSATSLLATEDGDDFLQTEEGSYRVTED